MTNNRYDLPVSMVREDIRHPVAALNNDSITMTVLNKGSVKQ